MLEEACNQKEEKDARIEELEEQLETMQQDRDRLAKDIHGLQGKPHGRCRWLIAKYVMVHFFRVYDLHLFFMNPDPDPAF